MSTPVKSLSAASGKDKTLDTETASVKTQDEFFQTTIDSPTSSVFAKANKDPSQSLTEVDSSIGYFNLISVSFFFIKIILPPTEEIVY